MKKFSLTIAFLSLLTFVVNAEVPGCDGDCGKMVITTMVDGALNGSTNVRGVKVCVTDDISDMSIYGIKASSSTPPDASSSESSIRSFHAEKYLFPAISATAGQCFWVAADSTDFADYFGFDADFTDDNGIGSGGGAGTAVGQLDGNEAVFLFCRKNIDDLYGQLGGSSSGDPEYFRDGWVHRNDNVCNNCGNFDITNWQNSGEDALDDITDATTGGVPTAFSFDAANLPCTSCFHCGGLEICDEPTLSCPGDDGPFSITYPYAGSEAGTTLEPDNSFNDATISGTSDDPATTAGGNIVFETDELTTFFYVLRAPGCDPSYRILYGEVTTCEELEVDPPACDIAVTIGATCEMDGGAPTGNYAVTVSVTGSSDYTLSGDVTTESSIVTASAITDGTIDVTVTDNADATCTASNNTPTPDCSGGGDPCLATASVIAFADGSNEQDICLGAGTNLDVIVQTAGTSTTLEYLVTDVTGTTILDGPVASTTFNFDAAPVGTCLIWAVNYDDIQIPDNLVANVTGCFALSNSITVNRLDAGDPACSMVSPAAIPTMSEWGLIILTLLALTFVTVSVTSKQAQMAQLGSVNIQSTNKGLHLPFNKSLLEKTLLFTGLLACVAGVGTLMTYGHITMTDFLGTLIASPIFAYFLHLIILVNKNSK